MLSLSVILAELPLRLCFRTCRQTFENGRWAELEVYIVIAEVILLNKFLLFLWRVLVGFSCMGARLTGAWVAFSGALRLDERHREAVVVKQIGMGGSWFHEACQSLG